MTVLENFLSGSITALYIVASFFFQRYAQKTADSFFGYFSIAFMLLAVERIVGLTIGVTVEIQPIIYLFRLVAFSVIIVAILRKNRRLE